MGTYLKMNKNKTLWLKIITFWNTLCTIIMSLSSLNHDLLWVPDTLCLFCGNFYVYQTMSEFPYWGRFLVMGSIFLYIHSLNHKFFVESMDWIFWNRELHLCRFQQSIATLLSSAWANSPLTWMQNIFILHANLRTNP